MLRDLERDQPVEADHIPGDVLKPRGKMDGFPAAARLHPSQGLWARRPACSHAL